MKNILKSSALWYAASAALFVYSFLTPHLIVQIVTAGASGWILMSLLWERRYRAKQKELQRSDEYVDSVSQRIQFAEERDQAAGPESSETAPESPKPTRKRSPRKPKKTADE